MVSQGRHAWAAPGCTECAAPRQAAALDQRGVEVQLAGRAAWPLRGCSQDLGEGGKTRALGTEPSGFCLFFLVWFFFFFFDVCALTEAPVLRKRELAETSRTVQAQKRTGQNRGQLRGVGCPWGAATLSQEYKITTRVGMYAHLAYLLARSKCEK